MLNKLKKQIPDLVGELVINSNNNIVSLTGKIFTSEETKFNELLSKLIAKKYPMQFVVNNISLNSFTVVEDEIQSTEEPKEVILEEVKVLYQGYFPTNKIVPNNKFKVRQETNRIKLENCIRLLNFINPIVLDSNFKVIDGDFRLSIALSLDIKEVPVVIIDDSGARSEFLRLALNRTSEFQRWDYPSVDDFADAHPNLQQVLEPIGIFGRNVLPTSFFANTVLSYEIDPYNTKQKQYKQEKGLAEWAAYRRKEMAELAEEKRKVKPKKTENVTTLFDLPFSEKDFLPTYDLDKISEERNEKLREQAGVITDTLDAKAKAEYEAAGKEWQRKAVLNREKAAKNREDAIEWVNSQDELTEEQKAHVVENIVEYSEYINNLEGLKEKLGEEN